MKKTALSLLLLTLLQAVTTRADAQSETTGEYPKGKPIIMVFGDASAGFSDGKKTSLGFSLERAYLGYQYELNQNWKAKAVYDMGRGEDGKLHRVGYLKNAEIDYRKGRLTLNMGLTATTLFQEQEKFWELRYVYMSYMDKNKWGSSADLGLTAAYQFTSWFSADAAIFNGEGYKKVQLDDQLLYGLGLTFRPLDGLTLRAYAETKTAQDTASQQNIALFAGYKCKAFRLGAEYNVELNQGNARKHNLQAVSVYGAGRLNDRMEIYGRYDYGTSSAPDDWQYEYDGHTGMLGLHWQVNKLFAVSPNVRLIKTVGQQLTTYACVSGKINL